MAIHHITNGTSVLNNAGDAFVVAGPGTLTVDPDAYLISLSAGDGANLFSGSWTVKVDGAIGSYGIHGLRLNGNGVTDFSTVTVGTAGEVFGSNIGIDAVHPTKLTNMGAVVGGTAGIWEAGNGDYTITNSGLLSGGTDGVRITGLGTHTIINSGTISGGINSIKSLAVATDKVTNRGTIIGNVDLGGGDDVFTDFKKVGTVVKHGTVLGIIDMGNGNDTFTGGSKAETVRDAGGGDIVKFGAGNDTYLAVKTDANADGTDTIDGGAGIDTYDASASTTMVDVNLDSAPYATLAAKTATGTAIGTDTITSFENIIGSTKDDHLLGNSSANIINGGDGFDALQGKAGNDTLIGGNDGDSLEGGAGRDVLTGGAGADVFYFQDKVHSGITAATRDVITDFQQGIDHISLAMDADTKTAGNQDFHATGNGGLDAFTHTAGELRYALTAAGTILSGDVNGDGKADFSIAIAGNIILDLSATGDVIL